MDTIINDSYYDKARIFIQSKILESHWSDEIKAKLTNLYGTLTSDNALQIYEQANEICNKVLNTNHKEFMYDWLKFWGTGLLISSTVGMICYAGEKYTRQYKRLNGWLETGTYIAIGVSILCFSGIMATGH